MSEQKVLKAIRAKCLECALTKTEVKRCEMKDCALYPYRNIDSKGGDKKVLRGPQVLHLF